MTLDFDLDGDLEDLDLDQLRQRLQMLEQGRNHYEWEHLHTAYVLVILNYNDLAEHLLSPRRDFKLGLELTDQNSDSQVKREFTWRTHQLLMNFTAGARMLVDVSRRFMKLYELIEPDLFTEYQERVSAIAKEPLARFIQDSRNYLLHCDLPWTGTQLTLTPGKKITNEFPIKITLNGDAMKSFKKWDKLSRDFILGHPNVDILDVSEVYSRWIEETYTWLFEGNMVNIPTKTAQRLNAVNSRIHEVEQATQYRTD